MASERVGLVAELGKNNIARSRCTFTASEVPEACGIGYSSRAEWHRNYTEGRARVFTALGNAVMLNGTIVEPLAKYTYIEALVDDEDKEHVEDEPFWWRRVTLNDTQRSIMEELHMQKAPLTIGASPDLVVVHGNEEKICVEIKCVDARYEENAFKISPNHVLQSATQLYVTNSREGHLFYYRSLDSRWVCYRITLQSPEVYEALVFPWLDEALRCGSKPMQRGERDKRIEAVARTFLSKS